MPEVIHRDNYVWLPVGDCRYRRQVRETRDGVSTVAQTTQAQQAELQSAAARFEQVNGELQSMLSTLMRELETTRTGWQGAGGRSFDTVKQAWNRDQETLNKNLLETAEGLRSAGRNYQVTDTDAGARFRGIGTRQLPL